MYSSLSLKNEKSINSEDFAHFPPHFNFHPIHIILHNMQDPYKEVFTLRVFGELSFRQIASLFGKTENWAAVTFHRAKQKIMHAIQNN